MLFGWWYTIDQGERGVVLRNGAIIGTADPGWHAKIPWIDSVETISVQTHIWEETFEAYSQDQQPATMQVSVNYRAQPSAVENIYSSFGSLEGMADRVLIPRWRQEIKTAFGKFGAATAISDRAALNISAGERVMAVTPPDAPVTIDGVQIEDIAFSDAYENSIEQRMQAEVEVQRTRQNAERDIVTANKDAQQKVIGAKAEAERLQVSAQAQAVATRQLAAADADATRLRGDAEASAIRARAEALAQNPALVELVRAERWNGTLPTTMLPNGTVPFLTPVPMTETLVEANKEGMEGEAMTEKEHRQIGYVIFGSFAALLGSIGLMAWTAFGGVSETTRDLIFNTGTLRWIAGATDRAGTELGHC